MVGKMGEGIKGTYKPTRIKKSGGKIMYSVKTIVNNIDCIFESS